ncbi:MAG: pre-16S rRNA-processing nuclease YqgF [Negativicutes bacterium]|nr:pre-16S rRNA-processing nuclease YqgF [Negativicutes bacterium]
MINELILGIDPGSSKSGVALLDKDGNILRMEIILMDNFQAGLQKFLQENSPKVCVLGDGTTSASMQEALAIIMPATKVVISDEAYSTEEARKLYWEMKPPQGWRKLIPRGLLTPPVPLDAYAAVVLARRYLAEN